MAWVEAVNPPGETPAHYEFPNIMSDVVVLGHSSIIEFAKNKRKESGQIRESLLSAQKLCTQETRNIARGISDLASEYLKEFRAWDFLIRFMEGDAEIVSWRRPCVQEEIAPYLDRACSVLTFGGG
jgi:hypothetical protein